jgi:hypothetical protein
LDVIALSPKTRSHVAALFCPGDVDAAELILVSRCGDQLPGVTLASADDLERIRIFPSS